MQDNTFSDSDRFFFKFCKLSESIPWEALLGIFYAECWNCAIKVWLFPSGPMPGTGRKSVEVLAWKEIFTLQRTNFFKISHTFSLDGSLTLDLTFWSRPIKRDRISLCCFWKRPTSRLTLMFSSPGVGQVGVSPPSSFHGAANSSITTMQEVPNIVRQYFQQVFHLDWVVHFSQAAFLVSVTHWCPPSFSHLLP